MADRVGGATGVHPHERPITRAASIESAVPRISGITGGGRMRVWTTVSLSCLLLMLLACGSSKQSPTSAAQHSISGNWVITLDRQANPLPLTYTGFLLQTGKSVTGSLKLGDGCEGVGPVAGTFDGQNLQLNVSEFGQDLSLTGTLTSSDTGGTFLGGPFSTLAGGCTGASTGSWTGFKVNPLAGSFHGTLVSNESNGTVNVAGTITQGANIGASNSSLSGDLTTTGTPPFCSYVTTASITGTITGTTVNLFFFAPNGTQLNFVPIVAKLSPDASSLTAAGYQFQGVSKTCTGDSGSLQLSFP